MKKPVRIAVIGSSTAAGQGAEPPEKAWVNRYRAYLKSLHPDNDVINLGLGGLQTFQLLPTGFAVPPKRPLPDPEHNITKALLYQPDAVIVNAPSNDAAAFYGPEEQLQNFDTIIQTARAAGVPVWIGTTQPREFSAAQIEIQMRLKDAILSRYGQQALNFWDCLATPASLPDPRFSLGDGAHLNNAGHARVFEQVKNGKLPEAIAAWKNQMARSPQLPAGSVLKISRLTEGNVRIEVYDAQARLRYRGAGVLPMQIRNIGGGAGQYWVRVAGADFHRLLPWTRS